MCTRTILVVLLRRSVLERQYICQTAYPVITKITSYFRLESCEYFNFSFSLFFYFYFDS